MFFVTSKHLTSNNGTFLASSSRAESSNTDCSVKVTRKYWELDTDYTVKECNGSLDTKYQSHFPSGTYTALNYTPQKPNHTFLGWFDSPGPETVPNGMTRLEYLHLSGTQYIDTGIAPGNNEIEFEVKYNDHATTLPVRYYFGAQGTSGVSGSTYSAGYSSRFGVVAYCCAPYASSAAECRVPVDVAGDGPYTLRYTGTSALIVGSTGTTSIPSPVTGTKETCSYNCYLGCCNRVGTAYLLPQDGDIYYCKIWKNGVLVRDYVPVLDSNNVAAFWDQVNDTVNYSLGTDAFVAGPGAPGTPLDYVSFDSLQYIDTEITPGNNEVQFELKVLLKAAPANGAAFIQNFVGSRDGSFSISNATDYTVSARPGFFTNASGFRMGCLCPTSDVENISFSGSASFYAKPIHIKYTGTSCIVNGMELPLAGTKAACNYPIYLGCANQSGDTLRGGIMDVYFFKIWKNGTLVRDYIPLGDQHGGAALYDKVSQTFKYPSEGEFGYGRQVYPLTKVPVEESSVHARWGRKITVAFDATTNGGAMPSGWVAPDYYEFREYGTLPVPTKSGEVFIGWYTSAGERVTVDTLVSSAINTLIARYMQVTYATTYQVTPDASYPKTGIYSATRDDSTKPIVIDWGDGKNDVVEGDIIQLVHTYETAGTYTVGISDNITDIALSTSNSTWYQTTSNNRYTVKKVLTFSSKITELPVRAFYGCGLTEITIPSGATSIPNYCFDACSSLGSITVPSRITSIGEGAFSGCSNLKSVVFESSAQPLTLGTYAFNQCGTNYASSGFTIDLSSRSIATIPERCFYGCRYLKGITLPQTVTTIGPYAFYQCFYASNACAGTMEIPEGVTTIGQNAFDSCSYLTAITLPSTLTTLNNNSLRYCTRLTIINCKAATAPTVYSATFGSSNSYYTGRTSYSAGTNKLYVPTGATGYTASYWNSVLLTSSKCGFTLQYKNAWGNYTKYMRVLDGDGYEDWLTIQCSGGTLSITETYATLNGEETDFSTWASDWKISSRDDSTGVVVISFVNTDYFSYNEETSDAPTVINAASVSWTEGTHP